MKRKKKPIENKNLKVALFFGLFVFLLIAISVVIKIFLMVTQSKFDGFHHFNLAVYYTPEKGSSAGYADVISFAPDTNSISVLKVSLVNRGEDSSVKELNVGSILKIPVDANITLDESSKNLFSVSENKEVNPAIQKMFLSYRDLKTNLTIFDAVRIWIFTKQIPSHAVIIKNVSVSLTEEARIEENIIANRLVSQFFVDSSLMQEKVSIQIINGTGVLGLGNRLSKFITNMGGNVVAVSTADKITENSEISYFGKETYTLSKLSRILGLQATEMQKMAISDVTITLGKDSLSSLMY